MPAYKLMYFDTTIRAEPIRVMFAEAGVKFEDYRVSFEEWSTMKANTPLGQLPVLMIGDMPLPQTGAIIRYLAREFSLNGDSSVQAAFADVTWESLADIFGKLPYFEKDEAAKAKTLNDALEKTINPIFEKFEAKMKKAVEEATASKGQDTKNCYFIGKQFTYADIVIMTTAREVQLFKKDFLNQFPTLNEHVVRKTEERDNIKAYLAQQK